MSGSLRIGVVGLGVFGGYHAGKCIAHPRATLVGGHDSSDEAARVFSERFGVPALSLDDLISESDALVIACSATGHADAARPAIARGRHLLIEKPIAHTVALAEAVVHAAEEAGVLLQVGHQERFVAQAIGLDRITERPVSITTRRNSPASERGTDVSVTLDLMTHDIDLLLWLMGEDPSSVEGRTQIVRGDHADIAEATLLFGDVRAALQASRIADSPERVMEIVYPSGTVHVDFNAKTLVNGTPFDLDPNFGTTPLAADSLGAATDAFVAAVLDGEPVPITGGNGLRALRIAAMVDTK